MGIEPLLLDTTGAQSFVSGIITFPVSANLKPQRHNTAEIAVLPEVEATVEEGDWSREKSWGSD